MSNLSSIEFEALDISGNNYLSWVLDAKIHLDAKALGNTIKDKNNESIQDRAKAMIFIRHHLHQNLKNEYLTVEDPLELWTSLRERFDHQKNVILPRARYEWMHLRLQDFKCVTDYNSAVLRITSTLKLCGENISESDMLEKTYSTFHASNMLLQQQYREKGFKKHHALISCLLVAEQNNELLLKNHEIRPTGSVPLPEVNIVSGNPGGRGRGRGRGRGYGRNNFQNNRGHPYHNNKAESSKQGVNHGKVTQQQEACCFRCGLEGHWYQTCRTPKHFVDLYQASIKDRKKAEVNYVDHFDDSTHVLDNANFDVSNFLVNPPDGVEYPLTEENPKDHLM